MTTMEFLNAVIAANISDEMTNYAKSMIDRQEKRNAKAYAASALRRAKKDAPIATAIHECFTSALKDPEGRVMPWTSTTVTDWIHAKYADDPVLGKKLTSQKVSYLLREMVEKGELVESVISNPRGKGYVKGYTPITQIEEE